MNPRKAAGESRTIFDSLKRPAEVATCRPCALVPQSLHCVAQRRIDGTILCEESRGRPCERASGN
jgi:hypothetical protein